MVGDPTFARVLRRSMHRIPLLIAGPPGALVVRIWRILRSLAADGRNEDGGIGSLRLRRLDAESASVTLQRDWQALEKTALLRRTGAERLLDHLLARLPERTRGTDLLAETTLGNLLHAIEDDLILKAEVRDCLLYTSPSPRDRTRYRMPSSA